LRSIDRAVKTTGSPVLTRLIDRRAHACPSEKTKLAFEVAFL